MEGKKIAVIYEDVHEEILNEMIDVMESFLKKNNIVVKMIVNTEEPRYKFMAKLEKENVDCLITFAMAGFGGKTLIGHNSYNLICAKQIHILVGDYPYYHEFLKGEHGINLFFFADHGKWVSNWHKEYRGVQFFEKIPPLYIGKKLTSNEKKADENTMRNIIAKVSEIVEGDKPITLSDRQLEAW